MTRIAARGFAQWLFFSVAIAALLAGVLVESTRAIDCSLRANDVDCDREAASSFAANANGAVFDRINVLAGHVGAVDWLMEAGARYGIFAIGAIVALSWFMRNGANRDRRLAVYTAVLSGVMALSIASVIQHIYVHQRPFVLRSDVILLIPHGADPSFPSEHASAAFALATGIALFRSRVGLILLAMATIVGFSRIYVGLHYPADVGAGALIGIFTATVVWAAKRPLIWLDSNLVLRCLPRQLS